ncbi:MAG: wax ester/triacylglycerol synthase family O-acyltransferase [Gammaproteobacteria bacterium]|nr:wax ester/triacylglycerol synthase family O-acyltransferase [Gammaproteobacteria bacterium]
MVFNPLKSDRESMSSVDTAWLRMERPTNLMMITGVMIFDDKLAYRKVQKVIRDRFLRFARFRQRAGRDTTSAFWEEDPNFDLDAHVLRVALPGKADKDALQAYASELASTPLDPWKPMWQFHLVENYLGGSAMVVRIHHSYADGIALIQVLMAMTETAEGKSPLPEKPKKRAGSGSGDGGAVRLVKHGLNLGARLWNNSLHIVQDPKVATSMVKTGVDLAAELAKLALLTDDPPTPFKGSLGARKQVAWAEPLPLEEVRTIGKALGCTINDVLLASAAGALHSYLGEQGEALDGLVLRAAVPVNLRPLESAASLGNQFGLVLLDLPVGISNPLERLYKVHENMNRLKSSRQPVATYLLLGALGLGPAQLQETALNILSEKSTLVMTNVPGPRQPLYFAGKEIVQQMFWVPSSGSIGLGISILSYDGRVQFGLIADRKCVPEPGEIIKRFRGEFEKLLLTTLMAPWEERPNAQDVEAHLDFHCSLLG